MSTLVSRLATVSEGRHALYTGFKVLALGAVLAVAIAFLAKYAFHYYTQYTQAAFNRGGAHYWEMRGWLLMHVSGGTIALLSGPWQFWTGFRVRYARLHRFTGYAFLGAVAVGSAAAVRLAIGTTFGWAFGFALLANAVAWITTTTMAYYAILKGRVQIHKEWMVRAYIITFGFVSFRLLNDYGPTSHLRPISDRVLTISWADWVLPLLAAEVLMQLRGMRSRRA
jgi:hypothetical protein